MNKVMSMQEAVSQNVKSGDILFLSGMQHGEPSAAIHEIVRQKIDHLTMISCLTTTYSLLVGEGLLDKIVTGWVMQDPRAYAFSKAKSLGRSPVIEEYSHFGLSMALLAGQMGVPFLPLKSQVGSDMPKYNPNISTTRCPFTGELVGAVRAIVPDTGIIHVQRADADGNAQKWGSMGMDVEGINASRKVIVTTEKIVDSDVIRRDPNRTIIPGFRVQAVVEVPWGAHPMHLAGCYGDDQFGFYAEVGSPKGYEDYVKRLVYGVRDWNEYLKLRHEIKGEPYFRRLEMDPIASEPVYTGIERPQNAK
jgi:glutaconate CoA-transferase subunit A